MNGASETTWCEAWKPPAFPWDIIPTDKIPKEWKIDDLKYLVYNDTGYKLYANACSIEIPEIKSSTASATTASTTLFNSTATAAEVTSTLWSPTNVTEDFLPASSTTQVPFQQQQEVHSAGGGIIALIVIIVLAIVIAVAVVLAYLWKQKKKKSASINSLPLKKYENTNFLDNKARQNQCYRASTDLNQDDKNANNQYGSFPQAGNESTNVGYINAYNRNSREINIESPVEFDKMNISGHSGSLNKSGYDNNNFMNDLDQSGTRSPGASSQTPLFDEIDGTVLPNSVPSRKMSQNSIHSNDKPQRNGSLKAVSSGKLPPIDMTVNKTVTRKNSDRKNSNSSRKMSDTSLRSPKKKKPAYLQRKSEPVEGLEDITQDMAGNRKSV